MLVTVCSSSAQWNGQPYVFTVPVLPYQFYPPAPFLGATRLPDAFAEHRAAAAPAAEAAGVAAAAAAAEQPQAAAGEMGGDGLEGDGVEGNMDVLKLVLKLVLFVYILGQDGGPHRIVPLSIGAALVFLGQVRRRAGGAGGQGGDRGGIERRWCSM